MRMPAILLLLLAVVNASCLRSLHAGVYNLHLTTDNGPDYTDMKSFVSSVTEGCDSDQDKCIAIWRWGRRSRRQTSNANEDGRLIWDPILHYNSYGTMNCGVVSALNIASFLQLGYRARYIQLGDHTVSEVSWDDGQTWHMLDSSMSFFCYNHAGQIASCQEIMESHACELSAGRPEPGHYYLYHGAPQCRSHLGPDGWRCAADQPVGYHRTLSNGASSYTDGFSVSQYTQYGRFGRRYILNLLPGQSYTRYWKPLDRDKPDLTDQDKRDYYRPLNGGDPDEQHGLNNIRGNGEWTFRPALNRDACRSLFHDDQHIEISERAEYPHLHPAAAGQVATVTFKVSAANVITSMRIKATGLRSTSGDVLRLLVSRDAGINWSSAWQTQSLGRQNIELRLGDQVAGVTECLIKLEMSAAKRKTDVGLNTLDIRTLTQLNRRTLPKLTLGTNRVRLTADAQVESTVLWPALHAQQYRQTAFQQQDAYSTATSDGIYKATLGSAVNGKECQATWRLQVPSDITGVTYGVVATNRSSASYVALRHCFGGENFSEFYRKSDGDFPFDQQVLHTVAGSELPAATRQAFIQCAFYCRSGAATYGMDGIQDLFVRIQHKPRDAPFQPVEVTYNWTEHRPSGDVTRTHTERVASLPYEYTINTAGFRDPTMHWVRLRLQGDGPERQPTPSGYHDGEDVGPAYEYEKIVYDWDQNLALNRPYTTGRASSTASGNPDTDARELTNGKVIAPTDDVASDNVQAATAFWSGGDAVDFVVDLEQLRDVAGVRISTHQPNADYCHPARVQLSTSVDGQVWRHAGTIEHHDLWKPPADYEPWEHDDSPRFDDLPAGGRLAYTYPLRFVSPPSARYVRFTCIPQPQRGMGISELEVFDHCEQH